MWTTRYVTRDPEDVADDVFGFRWRQVERTQATEVAIAVAEGSQNTVLRISFKTLRIYWCRTVAGGDDNEVTGL